MIPKLILKLKNKLKNIDLNEKNKSVKYGCSKTEQENINLFKAFKNLHKFLGDYLF